MMTVGLASHYETTLGVAGRIPTIASRLKVQGLKVTAYLKSTYSPLEDKSGIVKKIFAFMLVN